jgi:hypothetical protein
VRLPGGGLGLEPGEALAEAAHDRVAGNNASSRDVGLAFGDDLKPPGWGNGEVWIVAHRETIGRPDSAFQYGKIGLTQFQIQPTLRYPGAASATWSG